MEKNINNSINRFEVFGHKYDIPFDADAHGTKNKILFESARLFSIQGYSAVSLRDIAGKVGITPGAVYNHFESKESLLDTILELGRELHLKYLNHLDEYVAEAKDFSEAIDILFAEPLKMDNVYTNYVYTLSFIESTRYVLASDIFMNTILGGGAALIKKWFDIFVERGWMKACDTMNLAATINHSIVIAIMFKVHTDIGNVPPYDFREMLVALKETTIKDHSPD